jgi:hypothetical protein
MTLCSLLLPLRHALRHSVSIWFFRLRLRRGIGFDSGWQCRQRYLLEVFSQVDGHSNLSAACILSAETAFHRLPVRLHIVIRGQVRYPMLASGESSVAVCAFCIEAGVGLKVEVNMSPGDVNQICHSPRLMHKTNYLLPCRVVRYPNRTPTGNADERVPFLGFLW